MANNINRATITGNLTRNPELKDLPSGNKVCSLRVAVNERHKNSHTGEWEDRPNYFNVTVWGAQGESCERYLSKGRGVAVDGRLQWRDWVDKNGNKRESVEIVADTVQFLGEGQNSNSPIRSAHGDIPVNASQPEQVGAGATSADDDIPF